jgi:RNA polymerase sigma-70 factor (ECF subfamily)
MQMPAAIGMLKGAVDSGDDIGSSWDPCEVLLTNSLCFLRAPRSVAFDHSLRGNTMSLTTCAHEIVRSSQMAGSNEIPDEFWILVERYRVDLLNQAYAILGSMEDAEDVVQETFVDAFRHQQKLIGSPSTGAWLRVCNHANAVDRVRTRTSEAQKRNKKQIELPERVATTGGFNLMDVRECIAKGIEALPDALRTVVVMYYWEHLPYNEIGRRLNISVPSVRRRLYEAAPHLYKNLGIHFAQAPQEIRKPDSGSRRDGRLGR